MTSAESAGNGAQPSSQPKIELTEPPLTTGEKVAIGGEASRILNGIVWPLAFSNLLKRFMNESAATEPKETKQRDYLHTKQQVLFDVHDELISYLLAAERLSAEELEEEERRQAAVKADQAKQRQTPDPRYE